MRITQWTGFLFCGALALAGGAAEAASERFDGSWRVRMVTDSGICDRSYDYAIAIDDGDVRYIPFPGQKPLNLTGTVDAGGDVNVVITRGISRVSAGGRLADRSGTGTWRLPLLGCSGRWTASRDNAPTRTGAR